MSEITTRKLLQICIATILAVIAIGSWLTIVDSKAMKQIDSGLNRALISYATARSLNAVISVAQGTELAIEPGGVGVNFTIGQALHPINELIEQFSTLMLVACVAFGVQKILINIGGYWFISLILTATVIGWAWFYFRQQKPPSWLSRILIIILMVRFAIPIVTLGTDLMFQKFMSSDYQVSQQSIDAATSQATELNAVDAAPNLWSQTKAAVDIKSHYTKLKQTAEQWAVHIIKLIVIFLLQTLIIPVLLVWALFAVARSTFEFRVL